MNNLSQTRTIHGCGVCLIALLGITLLGGCAKVIVATCPKADGVISTDDSDPGACRKQTYTGDAYGFTILPISNPPQTVQTTNTHTCSSGKRCNPSNPGKCGLFRPACVSYIDLSGGGTSGPCSCDCAP